MAKKGTNIFNDTPVGILARLGAIVLIIQFMTLGFSIISGTYPNPIIFYVTLFLVIPVGIIVLWLGEIGKGLALILGAIFILFLTFPLIWW